jgi:hypothetical protein
MRQSVHSLERQRDVGLYQHDFSRAALFPAPQIRHLLCNKRTLLFCGALCPEVKACLDQHEGRVCYLCLHKRVAPYGNSGANGLGAGLQGVSSQTLSQHTA